MQMIINQDNYRSFPAVSNSDLTELQKKYMSEERMIDVTKAYANGTLIDCMLTEPTKVNYTKRTVQGEKYQFSADEFAVAEEMKKAVRRDPFCQQILKIATFQKISYNPQFEIQHEGMTFHLSAKCKWDWFVNHMDLNGDFKSTMATTEKQCIEAMHHFEYPRSRAWYMDLENRTQDMLIFISKKNFKVFKIPIRRGDDTYKAGKAKYQEWASLWWSLFRPLPTGTITLETNANI